MTRSLSNVVLCTQMSNRVPRVMYKFVFQHVFVYFKVSRTTGTNPFRSSAEAPKTRFFGNGSVNIRLNMFKFHLDNVRFVIVRHFEFKAPETWTGRDNNSILDYCDFDDRPKHLLFGRAE